MEKKFNKKQKCKIKCKNIIKLCEKYKDKLENKI